MNKDNKLELKATLEVSQNDELYRIIDFLNKNLKQKDIIFGLAQRDGKMMITIYET